MLLRKNIALLGLAVLVAGSLLATQASAETVMKFDLAGSPGPDLSFTSGVLATIPDGLPPVGDKSTDVVFQGFLAGFFPDITSGASLTLSGVTASGSAQVMGGGFVGQATSGGSFSIFDDSNALLLAGNFGGGVITGTTAGSTGAFFSTTPVTFTGGSVFPYVIPDSGAFSLSFTDIRTDGVVGLRVESGVLANFTAVATGQLEAVAVPEPSVIGMAAIGVLAVVGRHRRRAAKKKAAVAGQA